MNRNGAELTRNNKFKPRLVTPQIAETATKLSRFRAAANELRADLAQARDARERARNQIRAEIENAAIAEPAIWERLYRVGRWVQAKIGDPQAMLDCKGYGLPIVLRAAGDAVNSAGGVLVRDELADMIIALRDPRGSFRAAATVLPMGSDVKNAPRRTGGMTAFFTSENAALTESSSETWDNVGLTAKKITAFAKISAELGEDAAIDVGVYFLAEVSYAFATLEDSCGWNGDGTSTFAGIRGVTKLLTDGSHNAGKVAAAT